MHTSSLKLTEYGICFGTKVILADITLTLPVEGVTVLMGPVGTGKSSLLCSLAGINNNNPRFKDWGSAYLNNQSIDAQHRPVLIRQQIGQLNESVEDVILRQAKFSEINLTKRREFVSNLIAQFAANPLLEMLRQRLIDIKPVWQRIALMIGESATNPSLLMIDEPTSDLNAQDAAIIVNFARQLGKRLKLIVVLHNQQQARELADDIILLAGGRVQYHGAIDTFFNAPPNDIVKQFVQTGSVSLPAPDALKENLADDVVPPPPLPQSAIAAIKAFSAATSTKTLPLVEKTVSPAQDAKARAAKVQEKKDLLAKESLARKLVADTTIVLPQESEASIVKVKKNLSGANHTTVPAKKEKRLVELPMPSKHGVGIVAEIGKTQKIAHSAPSGFSWIVPDLLAGCPMPGVSAPMSYDLDLLVKVGITVLITLTEEDLDQEELEAAGLRNLHLPIYDREAPSLTQMHMLLFKMQKLIEMGEVLAVHCLAGIGRTGTVLAAWMVKEGGLSAEEAIRRLRLINPSFVQSEIQELFLAEFESDILKRMR